MANQETMVAFFRQLLGREPDRVGGIMLWTGVDPSRLA
jgi:hypothetical protein